MWLPLEEKARVPAVLKLPTDARVRTGYRMTPHPREPWKCICSYFVLINWEAYFALTVYNAISHIKLCDRVERQFSYSYPRCCHEKLLRFRAGIKNHDAFSGKAGNIHEWSQSGVRQNRRMLALLHPSLGHSYHPEGETLFARTSNNACPPSTLQDLINSHYYCFMSFIIITRCHTSLGIIWRNETTWQTYIFEFFNVYLSHKYF